MIVILTTTEVRCFGDIGLEEISVYENTHRNNHRPNLAISSTVIFHRHDHLLRRCKNRFGGFPRVSKKEDIEQAMIDSVEWVNREGGAPESMWHPDFGWVLWNNQPTETTDAFYKYLKEQESK